MLRSGETLQIEALSSLASKEPKQLLIKQSNTGKRLLHHIYQQFCTSGLIPVPQAEDDVHRLHALFDVALQHGLASVIIDYVLEVCSDPTLTSRYITLSLSKPYKVAVNIISMATFEEGLNSEGNVAIYEFI